MFLEREEIIISSPFFTFLKSVKFNTLMKKDYDEK